MSESALRLLAVLVVAMLLPCAPGVAQTQELPVIEEEAIEVLQRRLDAMQSMQADFEQRMYNTKQELTQSSSGQFSLLRPGRFRWDYLVPFEQTIVADGERLWIYDADLEQVTVRRMDAGLGSTPAMLLSGAADVGEAYSVTSRFAADGIDWLELEPRAADSDFGRVRLGFNAGQLSVMDLVDSLGQTTRILFSAIRQNPDLGDELFKFETPEGADVIRADEF